MFNKLGHYLYKRICKDQKKLSKSRPMNMYGLYVSPKDIQRYVNEYTDYGIFDGVYLPQRINIRLLLDKASADQMNFSGDDAFGAVSVKLSIGSWSYNQRSE